MRTVLIATDDAEGIVLNRLKEEKVSVSRHR